MRVVSGKYGSRPLKAVAGTNTRPTTDKIKESLFNLIGTSFTEGTCLDLYAGSGALGIEAVSRGMDRAVLCERFRPALEVIEKNVEMTKEIDRFTILKGDNHKSLEKFLEKEPVKFDLVFIDPPYAKQQSVKEIEWLSSLEALSNHVQIVCETDSKTELPITVGLFTLEKVKNYGSTRLHIYTRGDENES